MSDKLGIKPVIKPYLAVIFHHGPAARYYPVKAYVKEVIPSDKGSAAPAVYKNRVPCPL